MLLLIEIYETILLQLVFFGKIAFSSLVAVITLCANDGDFLPNLFFEVVWNVNMLCRDFLSEFHVISILAIAAVSTNIQIPIYMHIYTRVTVTLDTDKKK